MLASVERIFSSRIPSAPEGTSEIPGRQPAPGTMLGVWLSLPRMAARPGRKCPSRRFLNAGRRPGAWMVRFLLLVGVLSGVSGCRTNSQVALLEMENRLLEDRIYQLEAQLAKQARQMASCQEQPRTQPVASGTAVSSPQGGGGSSSATSVPAPGPGAYSPPDQGRNNSPRSGSGVPSLNVEIPQESLPEGRLPRIFLPPQETPPSPSPPPSGPSLNTPTPSGAPGPSAFSAPVEDTSSPSIHPAFSSVGRSGSGLPGGRPRLVSGGSWAGGTASAQVQTVRIVPEATGPYNLDGQPGNEGITVGIVPLDGQGRFVPAAAPISMVVIDPAISDESARVARWDFTAEQIAALTETIPHGEPLRMALVWPKPPQHNRLHLFVRYITADGRKLQADMPLELNVQGQPSSLQAGSRGPTDSRNVGVSVPPGENSPATPFPGSPSSVGSHGLPGHPPRGLEPLGSLRMDSPAAPISSENLPAQPARQARIPWKPTR